MTDSEKRELKEWVAEHVAGYTRCSHPDCSGWHSPTTGSSCQLPEMDDAEFVLSVLKACASKLHEIHNADFPLQIYGNDEGGWVIWFGDDEMVTDAQTLPESLCLFARKLFSK